MSKICSKCKIEKDESEFYTNPTNVDGLDYYCKECKKQYVKDYNKKKRPGVVATYVREYQKDNQEFVESLKTKCCKCGEDRPWVIQFHHIDHRTKEFNLGQCGTHSRAAIWKEASKCVCLCSNCHDEFHHFFGQQPPDPVDAFERYMDEDY